MKNKKILALIVMAAVVSSALTACSFGGDDPEQVVVNVTPTPKPTQAPTPTPVPANSQSTTYTSKDKSVSISLPDATWANKTDTDNMLSFESPDQGKILILHGVGDDAMTAAVIPDTPDYAVALEQAADLEQDVDFVIHDYSSTNVEGVGVYSYTVEYLNEKGGYAYVVNKYFANEDEFYSVSGSVKTVKNTPKLLKRVKKAVESFTIKGDSSLKSAAPEKTAEDKSANTDNTDNTDNADVTTENQGTSDTTENTGSSSSSSAGSDYSTGDTSQARTIYDNDNGVGRAIYADGNGGWYDDYGNSYEFANDEDVYDQNGKDFYYHGEGTDVLYMPWE